FEIVDAKQVAAWMNTSLSGPVIPTRLKATGAFELSPRGLSFIDATFLIDANEAVGTLGLKLSGVRPAFDGTLAFEKLDLTAYQAKQPADSPPLAPGSETGADQAAIQLLQLFDADLRVSANSVKGANFSFGRSAASLNLKDGTVRADIAELEFGRGGRCGGQLTIAGAGASPVIALRGKVEAIDIGFLSSLLWDYPAVSGKGGLTLDVTARGVSLSEILRSLSGKTSVVVPSGGEIGIDVKTLAATVRAQPQTGWGAAGARSRTSVEGLTAEMSLDRGRLVLDRVSARAGDSVLTAHGSVGVASRQAELAIGIAHRAPSTAAPETTPPVLGTATAAGAIAPPGDAGQTVGAVLISGNLDAPDVRFVQVLQPPGSPASPEPSGAKP
ncbi:MAG: AsmA family protein, partial [Hyphomicrobiaceae bacterium]